MGAGLVDTYIAYKLIKMLSLPFRKMNAYKLGIIDEKGNRIRTPEADLAAKNAGFKYTNLHKIAINLKRLLAKIPFGRTMLAGFASALWLLKEEAARMGAKDKHLIEKVFLDYLSSNEYILDLNESQSYRKSLPPGRYSLRGKKFITKEELQPIGDVFGIPVYSHNNMVFAEADLKKFDDFDQPSEGTPEAKRKAVKMTPGQVSETTNVVGTGNIAGAGPGDIPPVRKKRDKFAGYDVFDLETEDYCKFHSGPRERYERWSKRLNMEKIESQEIKNYARTHPATPIIIRDKTTGMMTYLRRD